MLQELLLELGDLGGIHLIQMTAHTAVDDSDLGRNEAGALEVVKDEDFGKKLHIRN